MTCFGSLRKHVLPEAGILLSTRQKFSSPQTLWSSRSSGTKRRFLKLEPKVKNFADTFSTNFTVFHPRKCFRQYHRLHTRLWTVLFRHLVRWQGKRMLNMCKMISGQQIISKKKEKYWTSLDHWNTIYCQFNVLYLRIR